MQDLISVIVPVYQSEQYLERCLTSLLKQTYEHLEILLVDDGSPDQCPAICDRYAEMDARVKVLHQENGGASSARNAGLSLATGRYACFVDSDDTLPPDSIEVLYSAAKRTNSPFVAGVCQINNSRKTKNVIAEEMVIHFAEKPMELLRYLTIPGSYSPYAKLYDLELFRQHQIRFDTHLKCAEDALMIRQYLTYCDKVCLVPHIVYSYNTENEHSLSKKMFPDFASYFVCKLKALDALVDVLPVSREQKQQFLHQRAVHGLYISLRHYLSAGVSQEEKKMLVFDGVEVLRPYLDICSLEQDFYLYDWWEKHRSHFAGQQFDLFFTMVEREFAKEARLGKIKQTLKKLMKR